KKTTAKKENRQIKNGKELRTSQSFPRHLWHGTCTSNFPLESTTHRAVSRGPRTHRTTHIPLHFLASRWLLPPASDLFRVTRCEKVSIGRDRHAISLHLVPFRRIRQPADGRGGIA